MKKDNLLLADGIRFTGQEVWFFNHELMFGLPLIASFVPLGITKFDKEIGLDIGANQSIWLGRCYGTRDGALGEAREAMKRLIKLRQSQVNEAADALEKAIKDFEALK